MAEQPALLEMSPNTVKARLVRAGCLPPLPRMHREWGFHHRPACPSCLSYGLGVCPTTPRERGWRVRQPAPPAPHMHPADASLDFFCCHQQMYKRVRHHREAHLPHICIRPTQVWVCNCCQEMHQRVGRHREAHPPLTHQKLLPCHARPPLYLLRACRALNVWISFFWAASIIWILWILRMFSPMRI